MDLFSNTESNIISVSQYLDQVNRDLKSRTARIVGEVTGFQEYPGRNYLFFSIRDKADQSTIKCFMWKSDYRTSGVDLADGLEIIVSCFPAIYKPNGTISLQVDAVELVGEGALKIAYDKLKAQLTTEGLFDTGSKRALPEFLKTIGVITSKNGAVINDFLSNIAKCGFDILFVDSKVEGVDALKDLLGAVKTLTNMHRKKPIDVLVVMRGGGSLESFQAFNNETLVRALATFPVPVITGIGHDKDAPLVSFVSDVNVSTPTAVANLLSDGWSEARLQLTLAEQKICSGFDSALRNKLFFLEQGERIMEKSFRTIFDRFNHYFHALERAKDSIGHTIARQSANLDNQAKHLVNLGMQLVSNVQTKVENFEKILQARSPERQLKLGWSIARGPNGNIIRSVEDVKRGENFQISLADGTMDATKR